MLLNASGTSHRAACHAAQTWRDQPRGGAVYSQGQLACDGNEALVSDVQHDRGPKAS